MREVGVDTVESNVDVGGRAGEGREGGYRRKEANVPAVSEPLEGVSRTRKRPAREIGRSLQHPYVCPFQVCWFASTPHCSLLLEFRVTVAIYINVHNSRQRLPSQHRYLWRSEATVSLADLACSGHDIPHPHLCHDAARHLHAHPTFYVTTPPISSMLRSRWASNQHNIELMTVSWVALRPLYACLTSLNHASSLMLCPCGDAAFE